MSKKLRGLIIAIFLIYLVKCPVVLAADIDLTAGEYISNDGKHTIKIASDKTTLYDDTYSLTIKDNVKGDTLTGKLGTDKKSITFFQLNDSKIVTGAVASYKTSTETVYLYDYTVFSLAKEPVIDENGDIELWRNDIKISTHSDLQSAVDASVNGDIIKITNDLDLDSGAYIKGKNILIDGNNHTLKNGIAWLNSVFVVEEDATLTINNLTVDGNSTGFKVNYEAVNVFNKSTSIPLVSGSDSTDIKLNYSPIISKGNLILNNSSINNNYVNGKGGGINIVSGNLTLLNSKLNHNRAASGGGAIYIGSNIKVGQTDYSVNKIVIDSSTISSNYTNNGGAIYVYNTKEMDLKNTNFIDNTVTGGKGGAILISNQSSGEYYSMLEKLNLDFTKIDVDNCLFEGNWVGNDGAAVETHEAAITFTNTIFRKNVGIHYSSSCGTVSSYMDYPYEYSIKALISFDNCVFEENIGAASTIADHGSSIRMDIFNTKFIKNKATYNSLLLYASNTHFKNCTFEDEYVSRGVVDIQSYNQEVEFEGRPATIIFENVEFKGTKNYSTDILIRKRNADDINLPWTVVFKGTNTANINLWHKNDILIDGTLIGNINADSTILDKNIVITENSNVEKLKINKDKVLITLIYSDINKVSGYNWEGRKYIYVDEKTYTEQEFYLEHLLSEEGYELKLYKDSAHTIPWDYKVSKEDTDIIGSVDIYGRWEEHNHDYNDEIVFENNIHQQCDCGYLGNKLSLEIPSELVEDSQEKPIIINNNIGISENDYVILYQVMNDDGAWVDLTNVPITAGKYKARLTYNNMTIEKEYVINELIIEEPEDDKIENEGNDNEISDSKTDEKDEETSDSTNDETSNSDKKNPITSDNFIRYIIMFIASIASLIILFVLRKKLFQK